MAKVDDIDTKLVVGKRIRGELRRRCWDIVGHTWALNKEQPLSILDKIRGRKRMPLDIRIGKRDKEIKEFLGYMWKVYYQGELVFAFAINDFDYWYEGVHSKVYLRYYRSLEPWLNLIPHYPVGGPLYLPGVVASIV